MWWRHAAWLGLLAMQPLAARTWTSSDGKTLEGDFVSGDERQVVVKLPSGKQVTVPLARLSQADLAFVAEARREASIATPDKWPDKVPGPADFKLKEITPKKGETGKAIYQTRHFRFVCDTSLDEAARDAVGRLYESTWTAIRAMPLQIPRVRRQSILFDATLVKDMASYHAAGGPPGSAGVFMAQTARTGRRIKEGDILGDQTIVPYSSLEISPEGKLAGNKLANHVLAHEITHQMTVGLFGDVTWINEGFADYVGSIPYDGSQFDFSAAFRNITAQGKQYSPMKMPFTLEEFLTMGQQQFYSGNAHRNYVLANLCVAFFFHLDGKDGIRNFDDYMNSLARKGRTPLKQLLNGRDLGSLEEKIIEAWKQHGIIIEFQS